MSRDLLTPSNQARLTKRCPRCGEDKPVSEFNVASTGQYQGYCRPCTRDYNNSRPLEVRQAANKRGELRKLFNISMAEYQEMLEAQDGACAICGSTTNGRCPSLVIDHDHRCCKGRRSCGKCIRGLLCTPCNSAMAALDNWTDEQMQRAREFKERRR